MSDSYRIEFDRIGRTHEVEPLVATAADANHLAEQIYRYARPHLRSRDVDVDVVVDLEHMRGSILCGFHSGGTFQIATVATDAAVPA